MRSIRLIDNLIKPDCEETAGRARRRLGEGKEKDPRADSILATKRACMCVKFNVEDAKESRG